MSKYVRERLSLRKSIFLRDNHTCYICGKRFQEKDLHVDHLLPVKLGGDNNLKNLFTACRGCNLAKSGKIYAAKAKDYLRVDSEGNLYVSRRAFHDLPMNYIRAIVELHMAGKIELGFTEGW